ncbi:MAG: GGDEF domain-containing protein [Roseicyclus sp.]|uniref:GGDEF domain-containing protein n=1 Tax=Boseongicola sp. H5 TaxID=2763261 RepID=UPI001B19705F|nr:GGDEF domain-containing protein [Boseongicola sp. H5]MBO6603985.1 GGDEF domain-containing protein [Roseicyclus sp.]MBO6625594.1 GGDEF domain-containing protein [Roseicyclus sp.]
MMLKVRNTTEKWVFVAIVSTISISASVILTGLTAPFGLREGALLPALLVPLCVALPTSLWTAGMLLNIHRLNRRLEYLVSHDQMTNLLNRSHFFRRFDVLGAGTTGAIMIADIDSFKSINDTYGHRAGDAVIHRIAAILQRGVEPDGFFARFGGEEFVGYLPGEEMEHAQFRAEAIRAAVESQSIRVSGQDLSCTVSIGVQLYDGTCPLDQVLHAADEALYEAKTAGRNRVVRASPRR